MNIEERAEQALKYLVETDEMAADLKHAVELGSHKHQAILDAHFLAHEGPVEARKAAARLSEVAEAAYLEFLESQRAYDAVANKRKTESIVIEWLRSLNANRRQGS